ncbi:MAG: hypothetical protein ABSD38_17640 [Syntrophorhabdales bacterium]
MDNPELGRETAAVLDAVVALIDRGDGPFEEGREPSPVFNVCCNGRL